MRLSPQILEVLGAVLILAGLALWTVPTALIVAGLFLVVAANAIPAGSSPRAAVKSATGTDRRRRAA